MYLYVSPSSNLMRVVVNIVSWKVVGLKRWDTWKCRNFLPVKHKQPHTPTLNPEATLEFTWRHRLQAWKKEVFSSKHLVVCCLSALFSACFCGDTMHTFPPRFQLNHKTWQLITKPSKQKAYDASGLRGEGGPEEKPSTTFPLIDQHTCNYCWSHNTLFVSWCM